MHGDLAWSVGLSLAAFACGPDRDVVDRDALSLAVLTSAGVELLSVVGPQPRRLGVNGEFEPSRWTPDGCRVVFPGEHGTLAMVADVESTAIDRLTDAAPDEVRSETAWWSADGTWTLVLEGHPRYPRRLVARSSTTALTAVDVESIALCCRLQ